MENVTYQEYLIEPSNFTKGKWDCDPLHSGKPITLGHLKQWVKDQGGEFWVLGEDALPDGIEDIRSQINDEFDIVVAIRFVDPNNGNVIMYEGLIDREF